MKQWIIRNWIALTLVAVLLPVTAFVIGGNEWRDYRAGVPEHEVALTEAGEAMLGAHRFGPASAYTVQPRPAVAPEGTRVLSVTLQVTPGPGGVTCSVPTLREPSTGREWSEASDRVRPDAVVSTMCAGPGEEQPGVLDLVYAVPDDAAGPFVVSVFTAERLPEVARLPLQEQ